MDESWWESAAEDVSLLVATGQLDISATSSGWDLGDDFDEGSDDAATLGGGHGAVESAGATGNGGSSNGCTSRVSGRDGGHAPAARSAPDTPSTPGSSAVTDVKELLASRKKERRRQSSDAGLGALGDTSSFRRELEARRHSRGGERATAADGDAVAKLKLAVSKSEREQGKGAVGTGRLWHALADAVAREGDGRGTALCLSRAAEILERSADPAAMLEAAAAADKFARLCCAERRFAAAVPAYRRVLSLRRGVLGDWHAALAEPAMALAHVLHDHLDGSAEAAALSAIALRVLEENECPDAALVATVRDAHARMKAAADEATRASNDRADEPATEPGETG